MGDATEAISTTAASIIANSTAANLAAEATTVLNNLTSTLFHELVRNSSESSGISNELGGVNGTSGILEQSMAPDDDTHKNPELKYFSTVIIIFMGLTILIVPAICFVGVLCARARVFRTVREVAGRGWGFTDADVPYGEFGAEDYTKDKPESETTSRSRHCDVKVLVAEDNRVPSRASPAREGSFLRFHNSTTTDDEDDISALPPTFVHRDIV